MSSLQSNVFVADKFNIFLDRDKHASMACGEFPGRAKGNSLQPKPTSKPGAPADSRFKEQMLASIGQGQTFQVQTYNAYQQQSLTHQNQQNEHRSSQRRGPYRGATFQDVEISPHAFINIYEGDSTANRDLIETEDGPPHTKDSNKDDMLKRYKQDDRKLLELY